jgi:hypothetical protein
MQQGLRVIIVGRSSEICVAAVEVLMKKERYDETQFTTQIGGKTNLGRFVKFSFPITCLGVFSSCSKSADLNCSGTQMCLPIVFAKLSWFSKDLLHWIFMSPSEDVKPLLFIPVFFFGATV